MMVLEGFLQQERRHFNSLKKHLTILDLEKEIIVNSIDHRGKKIWKEKYFYFLSYIFEL